MCVRTKTSYDCGCVFKTTNECDACGCTALDRYHYSKDGDCRNCKGAGADGTRGREGKGRYAKQMKRSHTRDQSHRSEVETSPSSSSDNLTPMSTTGTSPTNDVSRGISPWVLARETQKLWESPHRKQADEAWCSEHDDRLSDLQERFGEFSVSNHAELKTPSRRYVYEPEEYDRHEDDRQRDLEDFASARRPLQIQMSKQFAGGPSQRSQSDRSHRHQDRQHSDESLPDSMPSYRSSPFPKIRGGVQYTYTDRPHDYDSYTSSHTSPKPLPKQYVSRSKTEPYVYNRSPYSYDDFAPPMKNFYGPEHRQGANHRHNVAKPSGHHSIRYRPTY